jgi:hypothetical protein
MTDKTILDEVIHHGQQPELSISTTKNLIFSPTIDLVRQ